MPQLPTINSINPTTVPASPEMQFPNAFLTMLHFFAPEVAAKWSCQIATRNYNAANGILAPDTADNKHSVSIPDVADYATTYPVFAQTLGAVLVTAGLVQVEQAAKATVATAAKALASATALPASDTKAATVASAQTGLDAATAAYVAAQTALGKAAVVEPAKTVEVKI